MKNVVRVRLAHPAHQIERGKLTTYYQSFLTEITPISVILSSFTTAIPSQELRQQYLHNRDQSQTTLSLIRWFPIHSSFNRSISVHWNSRHFDGSPESVVSYPSAYPSTDRCISVSVICQRPSVYLSADPWTISVFISHRISCMSASVPIINEYIHLHICPRIGQRVRHRNPTLYPTWCPSLHPGRDKCCRETSRVANYMRGANITICVVSMCRYSQPRTLSFFPSRSTPTHKAASLSELLNSPGHSTPTVALSEQVE